MESFAPSADVISPNLAARTAEGLRLHPTRLSQLPPGRPASPLNELVRFEDSQILWLKIS